MQKIIAITYVIILRFLKATNDFSTFSMFSTFGAFSYLAEVTYDLLELTGWSVDSSFNLYLSFYVLEFLKFVREENLIPIQRIMFL